MLSAYWLILFSIYLCMCERVSASLLSFYQSRQRTVSKPLPHNTHSFLAQHRDQITGGKKAISPDGNAREPNEVLAFFKTRGR